MPTRREALGTDEKYNKTNLKSSLCLSLQQVDNANKELQPLNTIQNAGAHHIVSEEKNRLSFSKMAIIECRKTKLENHYLESIKVVINLAERHQ